MGRKIFVSYKYADGDVRVLNSDALTTARRYVDALDDILADEDHIFKGEDDENNLSELTDATIEEKLRDRIYDSTLTIVLISKGMKAHGTPEKKQWIPWEISYSLRQQPRNGRTKGVNAVLAVVLPDRQGSYGYYITEKSCPSCECRTLNTPTLFNILSKNMFNVKNPQHSDCDQHSTGLKPYLGEPSYIYSAKWDDFESDPNKYIERAYRIRDNSDDFDIVKNL
ncbi:TIR domain-containing protein [Paraburkholderia aspalathi]|uniref:MTH538 TIR-like domain n=1 Tax=Paraburkholderia aspalathi TaxID=1324617 RepID=A0A1I7BDY7_9BURK|nr:TIR domain-containing protein [Paraburkholderia aspalathi]SFT85365.1 MTH538 TIR-like domain [Paraburkholderia aspalathi]